MIKASGGIKSLQQVKKVLAAGANRIGTSAGIIIMEEIKTLENNEKKIVEKNKIV